MQVVSGGSASSSFVLLPDGWHAAERQRYLDEPSI